MKNVLVLLIIFPLIFSLCSCTSSTTIQKEISAAGELVAEINRLNSDINSYEYNCEANGYRLLEGDLEFSNKITLKVLIEKEEKRGMLETSMLTSAHSADTPEETETRFENTYIEGNTVYYGLTTEISHIDYSIEHNVPNALKNIDVLDQQINFLNSSEVTLLKDADTVKGNDCYVLELDSDLNTLIGVMIVPSAYEAIGPVIDSFAPHVKDYSYKYWFSKDSLHLVKVYQYMEIASDDPDYPFYITYEWKHEFFNYNENMDIIIPVEAAEAVIQDSLLAQGIREALSKEEGSITPHDLASLKELDVSHYGISSIAGLEYCVNLEYLDISYHEEKPDLSPISGLIKLQTLKLSISGDTDLTPISNLVNLASLEISTLDPIDISPILTLPNITELDIEWDTSLDIRQLEIFPKLNSLTLHADRDITDLTPLTNLNLTQLTLSASGVRDISKLTQLDNLESLSIYASNLTDISPLTQLQQLEYLNLDIHDDADFSSLSELFSLKSLQLSKQYIHDISFLSGLMNLESLILDRNDIVDITPLSRLTNLIELELDFNDITDLSPLSNLIKLESLSISNMDIGDISPLATLINLKFLQLAVNNIDNISVVVNFQYLEVLYLGHNEISDISPLRNLHNLHDLAIDGNPISDITPLVENYGLGDGDEVSLEEDYINAEIEECIKILEGRGVTVYVW